MITAIQLKNALVTITLKRAEALLPLLLATCEKYGITKQSLPYFLANLAHESQSFSIKIENLYYTTPARLMIVWPSRFNSNGTGGKKKASLFVRNPEALAELSYGGRMGNVKGSGDAFLFRGGGFAQLTGRDAYQQYFDYLRNQGKPIVSVEDLARMVQTQDYYAMDAAGWLYSVFKNLNNVFDFKTIVKRWNGGLVGYNERLAIFDKCKATF